MYMYSHLALFACVFFAIMQQIRVSFTLKKILHVVVGKAVRGGYVLGEGWQDHTEKTHLAYIHMFVFLYRQFLEIYGEIYFRAWKLASGPYLKVYIAYMYMCIDWYSVYVCILTNSTHCNILLWSP